MGDGARTIGGIEVHPAAELFPEMGAEDFERLKESIRSHGVRVPLAFYDNKILDGRNRLRAYVELGLPMARLPREGLLPSVDPYAYAWDRNCERLDYTESQKAAIRIKIDDASGELQRVRAAADAATRAARAEGGKQGGRGNKKPPAAKAAKGSQPQKRGSPEARHIAEKAQVSVDTASRVLDLKEKDPVAFEHLAATGELPPPKPKPQPKTPPLTVEALKDYRTLARFILHNFTREDIEHLCAILANAAPASAEDF